MNCRVLVFADLDFSAEGIIGGVCERRLAGRVIAHDVSENVASDRENEQVGALLVTGDAVRVDRCVARGLYLAAGRAELAETFDAIGDGIVLEKATMFSLGHAAETVERVVAKVDESTCWRGFGATMVRARDRNR